MRNSAPVRLALAMIAGSILASAASAAGAPEYNGVFAERDPKSGAFTSLERTQPTNHEKIRALGYGGAKMVQEIVGEKSPVRFPSGAPLEFVVRESSRDEDPNTLVQFVTLQSKGGLRSVETVSVRQFSGVRSTAAKSAVSFTADKFKDVYYRIVPSQPLPPGEYALQIAGPPMQSMMVGGAAAVAYCFGVDP